MGGAFESEHGVDLIYVNKDLAWGWKTWYYSEEARVPQHLFEVVYTVPGFDAPVHVWEKKVSDPVGEQNPTIVKNMVSTLAALLTDESFRLECASYIRDMQDA